MAYIDEAGDDGLRAVKPVTIPGASEWLILSAVVIRADHQSQVADWIGDITASVKNHQAKALHFANLNPANKLMACQKLAQLPVRCFVVASNKKNMQGYENPDAAKIPSQNWFYCWMTRLLLERVTRFVFTKSMEEYGEPRKVRLEYSARGGLSYSQMNAYYEWLGLKRYDPFLPWGKLCFEVMSPHLLTVYPHQDREGLQLADLVASAFFKACDKYDTGKCDPSFARALIGRMGREPDKISGTIAGFGVKLMPGYFKAKLDRDQQAIFRNCGYPDEVWWDPEAFSEDLSAQRL